LHQGIVKMTPHRFLLCGKSNAHIARPQNFIFFKVFSLEDHEIKNSIFEKNLNHLIFCILGFFDMRNSNLKEFFDFDNWKVLLQSGT
jgi:hypothetical protein